MPSITKLLRNDSGATTIEYAAIASLVSIVAIGAFNTIGSAVTDFFTAVPSF
ncbi:Flp family type IVb pilin [Sphingomonas sabuli]|uniref:Flp family type IVb pilin n=1 Tax=Sphingomonas sabuli TaxID=2764186 RepID=A0A7G9L1B7_9SPHN|nr:Flp family type IVb pilin [Sphingomonas sabuli]QNM82416.1 Flp family type IVb pilin [Sphingomonas sabuli]